MQTKQEADLADLVQAAHTSSELRTAANLCDAQAAKSPPLKRGSWRAAASQCRHQADRLDARPVIGNTLTVRGQTCTIVRVHPFGTLDVSSADGHHHYRVSGLAFR